MLNLTVYLDFFLFYGDSLDYHLIRKDNRKDNMKKDVHKFKRFQALESISVRTSRNQKKFSPQRAQPKVDAA